MLLSRSEWTERFLTLVLVTLLTSYQLIRVIAFINEYGGIEHDSGWALGVARSVAERGTYTSLVSTIIDPTVVGDVNIHGDFAIQTHDGRIWFRITSVGPTNTLLYALVLKIFGTHFWALRAGPLIVYTFFLLFAAYALYQLAGLGAIVLFNIFLFCYPRISIFLSYEALGEMPAMFFILWAYLGFSAALQQPRPRWPYFLAVGVIAGLAIYAKLLALLSLAGMFICAGVLLLTDKKKLQFTEALWLGIGMALVAVVWESIRLVILTHISNFNMYLRQMQARINFLLDEGSGLREQSHSELETLLRRLFALQTVAHPQRIVTAVILIGIILGGLALLWLWRDQQKKRNLIAPMWLGWLANTAWFVGNAPTGWTRHYWFGLVLATILLCVIPLALIQFGWRGSYERTSEAAKPRGSPSTRSAFLVMGTLLLLLIGWGFVSQPYVWSLFLPDEIVTYWREEKLNSLYTTLPWIIIPRTAQGEVVDYINRMPPDADVYYSPENKAAEIPPQTGRVQYHLNRRTHPSVTPHPADIVLVPPSMISPWRDPGIRQALLEMVEQACPTPVLRNDYYIICLVEELRSPE